MTASSWTAAPLKRMLAAVRDRVLQHYRPDSCIATTKAIIEIVRPADAYALHVKALVMNGPFVDLLGSGADPESPEGIAAGTESGAWAVHVGAGDPEPGKWAGHLVAIVERKWLVDASIDQASRPEHDIHLTEPVVAKVTEAFLRGKEPLLVVVKKAFIRYDAVPGDKSYRASPNWQQLRRRE